MNSPVDVVQLKRELISPPATPSIPEDGSSTLRVSGAFPEAKKDRRKRALSLTTQKPPFPVVSRPAALPTSSTAEDLPLKPTTQATQARSVTPTPTLTVQPSANNGSLSPQISPKPRRRLSLKDKVRKTFGLPVKEASAPGVEETEPKVVRFHFSVSTTSSKSPAELITELTTTLAFFDVAFEQQNFVFLARKGGVAFEIEICRIPRLQLNGLKVRRLAGDSWEYKNLCTDLLSTMKM